MRKLWCFVSLCGFVVLCAQADAQEFRFDTLERGQHEFSLLVGYGQNHRIPSATKDRFAFDMIKLRYGRFTSPRTEAAVDLSYGRPNGPDSNFALSSNASFRRYFLVRGRTAAAYDASLGVTYFGNHISSLGTKTNFTEQLGFTFQRGIGERSAFTLEYKFSHTSNAGIKLPNIGVNASIVSIGYSWYP